MPEPPMPIDEVRPLVHQLPRERNGELVFELPSREVAIGGDVDLAREVLSRCDGRRTVAAITAEVGDDPAAVTELIRSLVEQEVASDCSQAWRHFHRQSSVGSPLVRPVSEAEAAAAQGRFEAPHAERFHALRPAGGPLYDLAARRRSAEPGAGARRVGFGELSSVLALMYGDPEAARRPVPSGGSIYPLAVHVLLRRPLAPLDRGLWWYEPRREGLWLVRDRELDAGGLFVPHSTTDALIGAGEPIVFVSADLGRQSRKYGNRAYRLALMEVGAAMQNAYLAGAQHDLPVRAVAGVVEDALDAFLDLPDGARSLLAILLGT